MLLQALLIANGVLLFCVIVTAVVRFSKANKASYQENMNIDENALKEEAEPEPAVESDTLDESVASVEEVKPENPAIVVSEEVSEPVSTVEVAVTSETEEELIIGDLEEVSSTGNVTFASKLLSLDESVQNYYDKINNEFASYRRVHGRVSQKGVSYRLGRDLIAKITVRGKTMRLNLALDVKDFSEKIYFQKDMRDVKAYQDVPFMVKVKSDRGLTRAFQLIEALAVKENIEKKARYFPIDSIQNLKTLKK